MIRLRCGYFLTPPCIHFIDKGIYLVDGRCSLMSLQNISCMYGPLSHLNQKKNLALKIDHKRLP